MLSVLDLGPPPPVPFAFNLAAHVLAKGADRPGHVALSVLSPDHSEDWTYAKLIACIRGAGTALLGQGLTPGQRVLIRLGNSPAFPIVHLAAMAVGLVPIPTSSALTGPEITRIADLTNPALIVAEDGITLPHHPAPKVQPDLAAWADLPPCDWQMGDPEREAYVVMTSGTSGRSMAVAHAHRAILGRAMMHQGWEGLGPNDRLLHAGAFNWTYTMGTGLLDPWTLGATALIPAPGTDPTALPGLMRHHGATIFAAAPGIFRQMLRGAAGPIPSLRHALSAGEKLPDAIREAFLAATGTLIHEAFGQSELSTFLSGSPTRPAPAGSLGYAQPGRRLAIVQPDGTPVPRGQAGILAVDLNDPGLMLGYLHDPVATAARKAEGWFLTGDMATMAEDGAITYLGRQDDMMNAGGFRVSPLEVEAAFADVPGLTDCAVTEIEVKPGTTVIACFYCGQVDEALLRQAADHFLARWKQPRLYIALPSLPRGANNKLNRRALSALVPKAAP